MTDKKISELTNITGANLADTDEFVVVDTSASETKAITFGELKTAFDTSTGFVRVTGDTMSGDLSFGDNDKAIFGAGSDLQIYHDGSNSYIDDAGTGILRIRGVNQVRLSDLSDNIAGVFKGNAESSLYYNNASKLATTSTGVDVTGTITSDGLTVDGDLTVDTDTLYVDSTNNWVGIGTSSPSVPLQVNYTGTGAEDIVRVSSGGGGSFLIRCEDLAAANPTWTLRTFASEPMAFAIATTEVMRIDSSDNVLIGKTTTAYATAGTRLGADGAVTITRDSNTPVFVNRLTNDGTLIQFSQDSTSEGSISVSGTTVSYNGGHLSRWSQMADGSRPELLKGTVMSNLDQMADWDDEANEQLNCTEVSTVEGDANVAGVFVAWDSEDDGYNDILLAMTGDMVIRIAQGVTVQRGDLLMSAGDGTAKPQGDDIVRAKTIAKVTSTNVSHTYEDGSYCVPCVLMAC